MLSGFRLANRVLLFSESSKESLLKLPRMSHHNLQTLYLSVDGNYFKPNGKKQLRALTVGYINKVNMKRKGIQLFIDAARLTPEIPFHLSGKPVEQAVVDGFLATIPQNLKYLGFIDKEQLLSEYQQAKVYAQLSQHEGFGMALAEAMACECVPIVTKFGSIPEVVGDTGIYLNNTLPETVSKAIQEIIHSGNESMGKRARERIIELFPVIKRRDGLQHAIEEVLSQ